MKITVDSDKCTGHARCFAIAPNLYELDDYGSCAISDLEVPPGHEADARAGAEACPERAIEITV